MINYKNLFSLLMAVLLAAGAVFAASPEAAMAQEAAVQTAVQLENQLTLENIQALNDNAAKVFTHNDRVTFVDGTCTAETIQNIEDAAKVVDSMIELLGGDERTHFENWRTLIDAGGNQYYVFQQMYANTTVLGGAVKVIADPAGKMIGLNSSIETELPDVEESEGITAAEAEKIVLQYAVDNNQPELTLIEGTTAKMILPKIITIDDEEDGARFVWVVYTDNPDSRLGRGDELPYLAHYVTMEGEYLYSLATIMPGDTAGETGFDAAYVFEFMEPVDYTGYVDLSDGSEMELTVTVMRDKRTGMYYLGNIERQIVVADCYEFLYNGGRVVLLSSPDNLEWDQVGLLSLYNYCKAWDYYNEIGWFGGDGKGTPIMILNDMCDDHRNRIDNAAFIGNYLGWSLFGASLANDYSQALDIIAHEFTHCVTDAVMTYNSYMNDYGAINEAMSDIQGQICDLMNGNEADTEWIMGDKSATSVRSMSNPHQFQQPEFSWDLYYTPKVKTPTAVNDSGGVHSNSSLLNNVAYRLVNEGGMSLEEARSFWFAVDCAMVPGTDYAQLSELLPWMLKVQGMDQYQGTMQRAIDATRLGNDTMPDFFDADRALLTLTLPDNENFTDGNWGMQIISIETHGLIEKISNIFNALMMEDYSSFPQEIQDIFTRLAEEEAAAQAKEEQKQEIGFLDELLQVLTLFDDTAVPTPEPTPEPEAETGPTDADVDAILKWLQDEFEDVLYMGMGAAGQDGQTIGMIVRPGRTIPVLIHLALNGLSTEPDQLMCGIFMNGSWFVFEIPDLTVDSEDSEETELFDIEEFLESPLVQSTLTKIQENFGKIRSLDDVLDLFTVTIKGGEVNELPSTGLENVVLPAPSEQTAEEAEMAINEPGPKSRPKLPTE